MSSIKTFTYHSVNGTDVQVDAYLPSNVDKFSAVFIFYHGGFMITGDKTIWVSPWMVKACEKRNWLFLSANYRLLPEATGLDIVVDIKKLHEWVTKSMNAELGISADTSKLILAGGSAGGYMCLVSALNMPVKASIVLYPVADVAGAPYVNQVLFKDALPQSEADNVVKEMKEAKGRYVQGFVPVMNPDGSEDSTNYRYKYVRSILMNNLMPDFLTGIEGMGNKIRAGGPGVIPQECRAAFPLVDPLPPTYPPTIILHGDKDTATPIEEAYATVERLQEAGIPHELIVVKGRDHGFGGEIQDVDSENAVDELSGYFRRALSFVEKYLD